MQAASARPLKQGKPSVTTCAPGTIANADARAASAWLIDASVGDPRLPYCAAVPFLTIMGLLAGAHVLARAAQAANEMARAGDSDGYLGAKLTLAQFYATQHLPQIASLWASMRYGSGSVYAFDERHL